MDEFVTPWVLFNCIFLYSVFRNFGVFRVQCVQHAHGRIIFLFVYCISVILHRLVLLNSKKCLIVKYSRLYIYFSLFLLFFFLFLFFPSFRFCDPWRWCERTRRKWTESEKTKEVKQMRQQYTYIGVREWYSIWKTIGKCCAHSHTHGSHFGCLGNRNTCKDFRFNSRLVLFFSSFSYSVFLHSGNIK